MTCFFDIGTELGYKVSRSGGGERHAGEESAASFTPEQKFAVLKDKEGDKVIVGMRYKCGRVQRLRFGLTLKKQLTMIRRGYSLL